MYAKYPQLQYRDCKKEVFRANSFFEALLLQVENGKKQTPKVFNPDNPGQAGGAARGRDAMHRISTATTPKEFNPLRG
jgi:hypothetical protein